MISKGIVVAFLSLGAKHALAKDFSTSKGFMAMVHKKLEFSTGNLRRGLAQKSVGQDIDICDLVDLHFGDRFHSQSPDGACECNGTLTDTTTLRCRFDDVCDDFGVLCADIQVNATLADILDESGAPGTDPKMNVSACVDTDAEGLEQMCLELDFARPEFFLPSECSFSYGGKDCVCTIDKNVPCYEFNCTGVLPEPFDKYIVANTCKKVSWDDGPDPSVFLPALAGQPDDDIRGNFKYEGTVTMEEQVVKQILLEEESGDGY